MEFFFLLFCVHVHFLFFLFSFLLNVYCKDLFVCSYVDKYDLQEPSDDIQHVLKRIAVKLGKTQRVKAITGVGKTLLILCIQLLCTV